VEVMMATKDPCVAIIPAKWFSERFPNKNKALFNGIPLWKLAVNAAVNAEIFSSVVITTDDKQIYGEAADTKAVRILRPPELSMSGISVQAVVFHVLCTASHFTGSFCVVLPTSPLRTFRHLQDMWRKFSKSAQCALLSVRQVPRPHEYFLEMRTGYVDKVPAPEWRQWWIHDGTGLFCEVHAFMQHFDFYKISMDAFPIEPEESVDVNTEADLHWAEFLRHRKAMLVQI